MRWRPPWPRLAAGDLLKTDRSNRDDDLDEGEVGVVAVSSSVLPSDSSAAAASCSGGAGRQLALLLLLVLRLSRCGDNPR